MNTAENIPPPLGRASSLDGIRGVAVLAVTIFHLEWAWLPGGFLGVDMFFTLSGFLITTLLLDEFFQTGSISVGRFFARRGIRLYPVLVALVVVSTSFSLLFHRYETSLVRVLEVAAGVLGYATNWMGIFNSSGWFGGMTHTWSLAVEAHFYLIWAIALVFIVRHYSTCGVKTLLQRLAIFAGIVALVSAVWRGYLWSTNAEWLRITAVQLRADYRFA